MKKGESVREREMRWVKNGRVWEFARACKIGERRVLKVERKKGERRYWKKRQKSKLQSPLTCLGFYGSVSMARKWLAD